MRLSEMDRNELSITVLRFAVGGVFLWFGIDKLIHPSAWFGWTPAWALKAMPFTGATWFMALQGIAEVLIGAALITGKFMRDAALASTVLLAVVALAIGVNEVTVRDIGLLGASLSLLVYTDSGAKRRIGRKNLAFIATVYILLVFIVGVVFLRG